MKVGLNYILNSKIGNGIKITNSEGNDIEVNIYDEKYIIKNNEYVENKNLVFN